MRLPAQWLTIGKATYGLGQSRKTIYRHLAPTSTPPPTSQPEHASGG
jgi:predicted DNA-binding transcriptional regulator AlpA